MPDVKRIAIIGANKEGLKLLPLLVKDPKSVVTVIADPNEEAMLFKLKELGYRLSPGLDIKTTTDLSELVRDPDIDIIINALQDQATEKFLEAPEFRDTEKLGPLSARLIWGVRASVPAEGAGDKAHEQANLLSSLREIVDAVRLTIDRKELLSVILKLATESTMAERGSIMLVSSDEGTLRVEIAKGMDEEVVRKIRVPIGEGISGKVARDGKPILLSGKADSGKFSHPMERTDVKNSMCVPLVVKGEVIGVINVSSNESTHIFTEKDLNFLSSLAGLAAEVIQRSNEYEKLRVDAAKFTFWKEVDTVMSARMPLEKRLNTVCRKLAGLVEGLTCFIYIYDEDTGRLYLKASSVRDAKGMGLVSLRPGEGLEGAGVESKKDVFLVNRTEDELIKRTYMSLPMISHGKVVGSFNGQIVSSKGLSVYHESFIKDIRSLISESVYKFKSEEKEKLKSRKMFAVDEAGLEMISIKDIKRLATIIVTTPAAILGAEGGLLRLRQNKLKRYQTAATYGLDDRDIRAYFLPFEKEAVMEVLRKKETVSREFSEEASPYIRSVLSRPLYLDGEIVGVLSLFNKAEEGTLYPTGFSATDSEIFARFSVYAEKALTGALGAAEEAPKAEKPEAPSPAEVFESRTSEELNRARRFDKNMVMATVRLKGLEKVPFKERAGFERKFLRHLKAKTRSFDVLTRLDEETFGMLFLDTDERVARLADAVLESVASEDSLEKAIKDGRLEIQYGYATFPYDGDSFSELFNKASRRHRLDVGRGLNTDANLP